MASRKPYGSLFWDRIQMYPPVLLRLLAREPRGRPLNLREISDRSGLSPRQVEAISMQTDWKGVDLYEAKAFMIACGADLTNRSHCKRIRTYLASRPRRPSDRFPYLKKSPDWPTVYRPLMERFLQHLILRKAP